MKQSTLIMVVAGIVILAAAGYFFMNMNTQNNTAMQTETQTVTAETEDTTMNSNTIVDVAANAGTFTTLLKAAEAAGLVETLKGPGPFTVFAPTDDAFAKLPAGTVEGLLNDKEKLAAILTYHVVPGKVMADQVVGMDSATTVQGSDVAITVDGSTVMVNNATVTTTDIDASNGVIHVIDTVLMPQ